MAVNTFGVTAEGVRAHHFPQFDAWSASSNPTSTIVGEMVDEEAAEAAPEFSRSIYRYAGVARLLLALLAGSLS